VKLLIRSEKVRERKNGRPTDLLYHNGEYSAVDTAYAVGIENVRCLLCFRVCLFVCLSASFFRTIKIVIMVLPSCFQNIRDILMALDRGKFLVVYARSTFAACRLMPLQNAKFHDQIWVFASRWSYTMHR